VQRCEDIKRRQHSLLVAKFFRLEAEAAGRASGESEGSGVTLRHIRNQTKPNQTKTKPKPKTKKLARINQA
jgi:hypothetical protein